MTSTPKAPKRSHQTTLDGFIGSPISASTEDSTSPTPRKILRTMDKTLEEQLKNISTQLLTLATLQQTVNQINSKFDAVTAQHEELQQKVTSLEDIVKAQQI